ncbi:nucleotidyltransferase family protein [Methanocalculus taiwanensis]|uniref:nucleotidyltransferase family protein n=1 Tax=Methanocalculus taiwanensis TaxID=106207 RepID=UPI002100A4BD|nr:nucleotidyltransferase family protein [Methanocalculus taiwanensis]
MAGEPGMSGEYNTIDDDIRIRLNPITRLNHNIDYIRKSFGVARIGIFGSIARDEGTPESDVDILVEFREGEETFDNVMDLKFYLEDLFGRRADLVIADTLKPRIRDSVLKEVVYA